MTAWRHCRARPARPPEPHPPSQRCSRRPSAVAMQHAARGGGSMKLLEGNVRCCPGGGASLRRSVGAPRQSPWSHRRWASGSRRCAALAYHHARCPPPSGAVRTFTLPKDATSAQQAQSVDPPRLDRVSRCPPGPGGRAPLPAQKMPGRTCPTPLPQLSQVVWPPAPASGILEAHYRHSGGDARDIIAAAAAVISCAFFHQLTPPPAPGRRHLPPGGWRRWLVTGPTISTMIARSDEGMNAHHHILPRCGRGPP